MLAFRMEIAVQSRTAGPKRIPQTRHTPSTASTTAISNRIIILAP
jgi:hypothetical protein